MEIEQNKPTEAAPQNVGAEGRELTAGQTEEVTGAGLFPNHNQNVNAAPSEPCADSAAEQLPEIELNADEADQIAGAGLFPNHNQSLGPVPAGTLAEPTVAPRNDAELSTEEADEVAGASLTANHNQHFDA